MNKNDFEEFLKDVHAKEYTGTDDNMPDAYENWLSNMDLDLLLAHGDKFGALSARDAVEEFGKKLKEIK